MKHQQNISLAKRRSNSFRKNISGDEMRDLVQTSETKDEGTILGNMVFLIFIAIISFAALKIFMNIL